MSDRKLSDRRLIHYSSAPLLGLRSVDQSGPGAGCYKPRGLWLSVEGDDDWPNWCKSENFGAGFECATEIVLEPQHRVLWLRTAYEIDAFTWEFGGGPRHAPIDWPRVSLHHSGLIIAPYCWERRLTDHTFLYYGWDCASGVIWSADAVSELRPMSQEG